MSTVELIPATQARKIVENGMNQKAMIELNNITKGIDRSIADGYFYYTYEGTISNPVCRKLEELGYKIETGSQYNIPFVTIKW